MDTLVAGQQLATGGELESSNGRVRLTMQGDGNLVMYRTDNGQALWASNTAGKPVNHVVMQGDGNLVCYDAAGKPYWASNTDRHAGARVTLQSDGNFVVYGSDNRPLWASNTVTDWNVVTIPPQSHDLGDGHHIVADAELNMAGGLATFHMTETCTNKLFGFTAGVKLFYYDNTGRLLGDSGTQQYGINQAPIIGANHRSETWNGQTPAGTVVIGLATFSDPHNRFPVLDDIGNIIGAFFNDIAKALGDIAAAVANFCHDNPDVCAIVLFAIAAGVALFFGGQVVIQDGGVDVVIRGQQN